MHTLHIACTPAEVLDASDMKTQRNYKQAHTDSNYTFSSLEQGETADCVYITHNFVNYKWQKLCDVLT